MIKSNENHFEDKLLVITKNNLHTPMRDRWGGLFIF